MRQGSRATPSPGKVIPFPRPPTPPASRRAIRRRVRPGRLILAAFAGYLLVATGVEIVRLAELRRELHRTREAIALQDAMNAGLQDQIAYTQTDDYLEQAARQLGMVRPGEILFMFPESFPAPGGRE
ncbi:MAG TPA: septum formation initiator family protein [Bacillota bacterium]|nr:septum formation initiator family protein [Bacillota bacterium]